MEAYLKRKNDTLSSGSLSKKPKKEICPHAERCYRKNPHHFKEFEHPHLNDFIKMGDNLKIPSNMPQPESLYKEQLEILNPILKADSRVVPAENTNSNTKSPTKDRNSTQKTPSASKPGNSKEVAGSSKGRISSMGKTTSFQSSIDTGDEKAPPGSMLEKLETVAPYNLFFTTINKAPATLTQPNAITFTDLLCPSLGTLKCSLQINFMIDIDWLLKQYKARGLSSKPLTILYGDDWPDLDKFIDKFCPHVTYKLMKMKDPFGIHHSLWLSPACPKLSDSHSDKDGESPTGFKKDFLNYLRSYNEPILKPFIDYVRRADFSAVRVCFVASIPGKHTKNEHATHLHTVGDLLSRHCVLPKKTTPQSEGPLSWGVIAQSSSIGNLGKDAAQWFRGSVLRALSSHTSCPMPMSSNASISMVYPSVDNVMTGYYGPESGGCLPYSKATNEKQRWLQDYLYQWKAEAYGRTKAMPHIKSYCRVSPCLTKLAFFLLTSANLSKAAWGGPFNKDGSVYVRSYEAGVLFLPKFFDQEYFEIKNTTANKNGTLFPFMYDLPLTPYRKDDYPWCN
ncbi:unnamed protein product [Acanthoscelides obtectus]|uniref:PBZ-type domain-containing protein n=1 Tax=Acanthoscelides obtectus TaxID=200917 RepID=A0A9P0JPX9_ACAOB|nr:unnamed protein product [Acanthoscelides obtectus]CAK1679181.1 Probable tyrosyl-DNA phosphodiesterase [Acanthoscelides obtectus]